MPYSRFLSFSLTSFFCSSIPSRAALHLVVIFLGASWLWQFLTVPVLMTSTAWRVPVRYFVGCPFVGIGVMFFSWVYWGLVWGRKTTGVKCHFHHILWTHTCSQHGVSLLMLVLMTDWGHLCLSGLATVKLPPSPPVPYCLLWGEVTVCSSHLRSGELFEIHELFKILQGRCVSSFINSSGWTHGL